MAQIISRNNDFEPINDSETIPNGDTILKSFWVFNDHPNFRSQSHLEKNPLDIVMRLLNEAKMSIFIYTPYIAFDQIQLELDKISKNIRIYMIVQDCQIHEKWFKCGVMRENKEVKSTFIVIDPTKKPKGILFPGDLTKRNSKQVLLLDLNPDQINDAILLFKDTFWLANGIELFFGKRRICKQYLDSPVKQSNFNQFGLNQTNIENIIKNRPVQEMLLDEMIYPKYEYYLADIINLKLKLSNNLKKMIDFEGLTEKKIEGHNWNLGFNFLKTDQEMILLLEEFGIKIDQMQENLINSIITNMPFQYKPSDRIKNLNKIVLRDSDWEIPKITEIVNQTGPDIQILECKTMEEWIVVKQKKIRKKAILPDVIYFSQNILLSWTVLPPYLPKAKKHRIYQKWTEFKNDFDDKISDLISIIQSELEEEQKYKRVKRAFIGKKGLWTDYLNSLKEFQKSSIDPYSRIE